MQFLKVGFYCEFANGLVIGYEIRYCQQIFKNYAKNSKINKANYFKRLLLVGVEVFCKNQFQSILNCKDDVKM